MLPLDADYDEIVVKRFSLLTDPSDPHTSHYALYDLAQLRPGEDHFTHFYKAARLCLVTPSHPRVSSELVESTESLASHTPALLEALSPNAVLLTQISGRLADHTTYSILATQGTGYSPTEATEAALTGFNHLEAYTDQHPSLRLAPVPTTLAREVFDSLSSLTSLAAITGLDDSSGDILTRSMPAVTGPFALVTVVVPMRPDDLSGPYRATLRQLSSLPQRTRSISLTDPPAPSRHARHDLARMIRAAELDVTLEHYLAGVRHGAYLFQMYALTDSSEDLNTLARVLVFSKPDSVLSSKDPLAPGAYSPVTLNPLAVTTQFHPDEQMRLLTHARALTSFRRPERDPDAVEPFAYSTFATSQEMAPYIHLP